MQTFDAEVQAQIEKSGIGTEDWRSAGRKTKAYPDGEDGDWWQKNGLTFVNAYAEWRESTPWEIWETPAGEPAIELDMRCTFGDVPIRAIVDRVFVTPEGELVVLDLKTGTRMPKDQGLQLGFYSSAIEVVFGVRPSYGCYWNARTGGITDPKNVDHFTPDFLGTILGEFVRARDSGLFIPHPSMSCDSCGVRRACAAVNGPEAHLYDPLHPDFIPPEVKESG